MQHPTLDHVVIRECPVHGAAVIPDNQIPLAPDMLMHECRLSGKVYQFRQQPSSLRN